MNQLVAYAKRAAAWRRALPCLLSFERFAQYPRLGFLEVRVLEIALFAPRVCPYKFFSGDRNRRLCLGVDRKLREACLSEIFPDKISTGRSATKSRGEASTVRQSKSICTSGIELKKMFSLNTFFYLSSVGDRATMRGSTCEGALWSYVKVFALS